MNYWGFLCLVTKRAFKSSALDETDTVARNSLAMYRVYWNIVHCLFYTFYLIDTLSILEQLVYKYLTSFYFRTLKYSYTIASSSFVYIRRRSKKTAYRRRNENRFLSNPIKVKVNAKITFYCTNSYFRQKVSNSVLLELYMWFN